MCLKVSLSRIVIPKPADKTFALIFEGKDTGNQLGSSSAGSEEFAVKLREILLRHFAICLRILL